MFNFKNQKKSKNFFKVELLIIVTTFITFVMGIVIYNNVYNKQEGLNGVYTHIIINTPLPSATPLMSTNNFNNTIFGNATVSTIITNTPLPSATPVMHDLKVITAIDFDNSFFTRGIPGIPLRPGDLFITKMLDDVIKENEDNDVLYRVCASFPIENSEDLKDGIEERIQFAVETGARSIKSIVGSTDYGYSDSTYFMELSYNMMIQISERYPLKLRLAMPERIGEFNDKISDSLTYKLSQMADDEIVSVIITCSIDKYNNYLNCRNIKLNTEYFSKYDLPLPWESDNTNDNSVKSYINDILIRNNLEEKRIEDTLNPAGFDITFYNGYIPDEDTLYWHIRVGFMANLTKSDIVSLTSDSDIKGVFYIPDFQ